ncbi:MAG TPA: YCF48-related protein [Anaerolineales bacterium]|nr:YCF48-related protein [Anaerolineales bacterium]
MSKQRERERIRIKKQQQKSRSRWLILAGVALIIVAGFWFVFSNQQPDNLDVQPISKLTTVDFHSLAFSITEPETIFFGHHGGLLVSRNGGKDWEPTTLSNADAMALALPPSDPKIMYAAGHEVFFKSTDGGKTWDSVSTNLPGLDIHGFTVDPENASQVYAHVVGFGIFGSEDGGNSWTLLSDRVPPSTFNLAVGENSETLYAAAGNAGLWQSKDSGRSWTPVQNVPDTGAVAVAYIPANGRLYVTTAGNLAGLYVSDDNSQSWKSTGLNGTLLAIAVSPLDPNHIIAVNDQGEVFASRDNGITWLEE